MNYRSNSKPKHKQEIIFDFDSLPLEKINISVRSYIKGIRKYQNTIEPYKTIILKTSSLKELAKFILQIDQEICSFKQGINKNIENCSLCAELALDAGRSLESYLDSKVSYKSLISDSPLANDLIDIGDFFYEKIRHAGFELYDYFIGAEI